MLTTGIIKDITHNQLSIGTKKAILGQCLVLATALVLPILTHRMGLNFLVAQPMHWMVLFAGLVYGPVSGLILGVSIPLVSFFVSGMPLAFNSSKRREDEAKGSATPARSKESSSLSRNGFR